MTAVTGAGPWPGTDPLSAAVTVVGDLTDTPSDVEGLPFAPLLVDRGPWGEALGRSVGLLVELPAELGTHGWRLTDHAGGDLARSRSFAREDLDALAVAAHGYAGPLVVPLLGPISLAARVDLAHGDRVLADPAALRDAADSLAAGVAEHLAALVRAVPGAVPRVLLHEPLLAQAVAGVIPTFSGRGQLRALHGPVAAERVGAVVAAARSAGASAVTLHVGAGGGVVGAAKAAGADAVGLDVGGLPEPAWERVATAVEEGLGLWAQLPPATSSQREGRDPKAHAEALVGPWRRVGLPAGALADVVLVAGRPEARWSPDAARAGLGDAVRAARAVVDVALA
ncbi:MAG: hypothetical protein BGO37_01335 [Cellulomonas sp. 73-92]|uniref:hypothetical protein n=1 Tax=Cellulomonas sp. 73-92 TaxID=1895740 RepID=UPI00092A837A|nr:hypothetical protein [Cellulomonas sp. 73-92]OJV79013.1 MAG: hypothetical protein BGO37_01335 [Cellulomonas sp. 73-92]